MTPSATISAAQTARRRWDVIVVGAGPAGSTAARGLALRGRSVLLVDRAAFPRAKVCGCCLNGAALASLESVGLGNLTARCQARPLSSFRVTAGGPTADVPLNQGVALSREAFDLALIDAATTVGVSFAPQTVVDLGPATATARMLKLHQNDETHEVAATVVLAADGLGGRLLARAGAPTAPPTADSRVGAGVQTDDAPPFYEDGRIHMACARGGYVGLVRLENGRLDLAAAFDVDFLRAQGGAGGAASAVLAEVGWPIPAGLDKLPWRGTPLLTRLRNRPAAERVFALGDAAGYVEPFTGEGMAWALAAAVAVVPLADRAVTNWRSSMTAEWSARHRNVVGCRQLVCRAAAAVLRRPRLARSLIRLLAIAPVLAGAVVRRINSPAPLPSH